MLELRPATTDDIAALHAHHVRASNENGLGGIVFAPFEDSFASPLWEFELRVRESWSHTLTTPGWERVWVLVDGSGAIRGEIVLTHRPPLKTNLHRATLMMGIERAFQGQGHGTRLMQVAIDWARAQPSLEWLELRVFAHNDRARGLYERFGFREVGRTPDFVRVRGQSIDDVEMVLKLRG